VIHHRTYRPWQLPELHLPVPVDPTGLSGPTPGQARGPRWRRTAPNRYVPAGVERRTPEQRIAEAAGHLPARGAITGWAALRLRGGRTFDGLARDGVSERPVPLLAGPHHGRRGREGITWHYDRLPAVTEVRGLPCVPVDRAVFDAMRSTGRLFDAVVVADMAVMDRLVTLEELAATVARMTGWDGVPLARKALGLADPHSASPQESRLRLLWHHALGLPRPLVNVGVFDRSGQLVGYPDLLDPEAGLAIEYDGADHRSASRHADDIAREGRLRGVGLEVVRPAGLDARPGAAPPLLPRALRPGPEPALVTRNDLDSCVSGSSGHFSTSWTGNGPWQTRWSRWMSERSWLPGQRMRLGGR
jgi:hypothetical protein